MKQWKAFQKLFWEVTLLICDVMDVSSFRNCLLLITVLLNMSSEYDQFLQNKLLFLDIHECLFLLEDSQLSEKKAVKQTKNHFHTWVQLELPN